MAGQRFAPQTGAKLLPAVTRTSNIGFVAVLLLVCGTNLTALAGVLGSGAIGAAILFVVLVFAGAWALAEPNAAGRRLLGYATAGRNVGAALVTAGASAAEPKATVMLIVTEWSGWYCCLPPPLGFAVGIGLRFESAAESAGLFARPGRASLPAPASGASVRRGADAGASTRDRPVVAYVMGHQCRRFY